MRVMQKFNFQIDHSFTNPVLLMQKGSLMIILKNLSNIGYDGG